MLALMIIAHVVGSILALMTFVALLGTILRATSFPFDMTGLMFSDAHSALIVLQLSQQIV